MVGAPSINVHSVVAAGGLVVLSACGTQIFPGAQTPAYHGTTGTIRHAAPQFGVNLANDGGAAGTGGSKGQSWSFDWCDGAPGNPSGCYTDTPGKHKYTDNASGTAYLFYGTQAEGYTKAQIAGTSKIGIGSYIMSAETNETNPLFKNISAHAQTVSGGWDDTLYISSGTLKNGTPVTIGVKWVLTAQTSIACDTAKNSYGQLELYSPSVTPASGNQFSISGGCSNGTFVYYLYNNYAQHGATAVGTISTTVGASYPIYFAISGYAIACQPANKCSGDIFAVLDGKYKFSVTSITSGATFKSASGYKYK